MSGTLYVTDLDGTLLRGDQTLSPYTIDTINELVAQGMIFSYATARSLSTAKQVTSGLTTNFPVIIFNGSFVVENLTGRKLLSSAFDSDAAGKILDTLLSYGVYPIVYAMIGNVERYAYCRDKRSRGVQWFCDTHVGDVRDTPVISEKDLYQGEIFHLTCIDEPEILHPIYEMYCNDLECIYYRDTYSGEQWLEIQPKGATKAAALMRLKDVLGCDRVVCFGDGVNDISMFEVADECYAVANAHKRLKAMATAVIDSNEQDGVARWLWQTYTKGR